MSSTFGPSFGGIEKKSKVKIFVVKTEKKRSGDFVAQSTRKLCIAHTPSAGNSAHARNMASTI